MFIIFGILLQAMLQLAFSFLLTTTLATLHEFEKVFLLRIWLTLVKN